MQQKLSVKKNLHEYWEFLQNCEETGLYELRKLVEAGKAEFEEKKLLEESKHANKGEHRFLFSPTWLNNQYLQADHVAANQGPDGQASVNSPPLKHCNGPSCMMLCQDGGTRVSYTDVAGARTSQWRIIRSLGA